ncbi:putative membrane-anchored protein [Streptomyces sp. 1114.5]|uniref:COG4705 family protein n=1 Tax=Streptomyces sp. 1114.5 TaxID=1938830 RepID=UPI000F2AFA65|nr:putative membrane-anchored protein [Streptomyces sp. 1114.5]
MGATTVPRGTDHRRPVPVGLLRSKVPQVTAVFWVVKILTTGMGETTSDYLARVLGPVPAVASAGLLLAAALAAQARARRYVPAVYWTAVVMVSVFGTMAADVAHVALGVPYAVSTAAFALALAAVFGLWRRLEGTLAVESVAGGRREVLYWSAVLATFALGTAVGDLTAATLGWGYLPSGLLFAAMIAVPALAHRLLGAPPVLTFWWAYVLTRPLGACFADWAGVSHQRGGLDLGTGPVSLVLGAVIVGLVLRLSIDDRRRGGAER